MLAAASRIDLGDRVQATKIRRRQQDWQKEAWGYYDNVGEVKYSANYLANAIGRLRLFAAIQIDSETDPEPDDAPASIDAVNRLSSPMGGQSEILRQMGLNLTIAGECYLLGIAPRGEVGEVWDVRSVDEVAVQSDGRYKASDVPGYLESVELGDPEDFLARIWVRHPRYAGLADSPMRGVLSACEELLLLERLVRSVTKSRIAGSGLLLVPDGLSFGNTDPTTNSAGDGEGTDDPFMAELIDNMVTPIQDEGSASAVVPLVMRGNGDEMEKLRHITFDRPLDPAIDQRTERALRRLAQGLDVPVQVVLGMADVNHWTGWMIEEDTFKAHVEPRAILVCDALTNVYYRPALLAGGMAPAEVAKRRMWYDATKLVVRPDRGADAKWAHENYVISNNAALKSLNFTEADAPTDEELQRRVALQAEARGRPVDAAGLPIVVSGSDVSKGTPPANQPAPAAAPSTSTASAAFTITAGNTFTSRAGRSSSLGAKLLGIDQQLRTRLHATADATMTRALERAGNYLRGKAARNASTRAVVERAGAMEVAGLLGPRLVASFGVDEHQMLEGAFGAMAANFNRWTAKAQTQALDAVGATDEQIAAFTARYAAHRAEAWVWLENALVSAALENLYDPSPAAPALGEADLSSRVGANLIRGAMAIAGGAMVDGITQGVDGGLRGTDGSPLGGIGTGTEIMDLFGASGGEVAGYEWVYGAYPRTREFEPHAELDGVQFENFDDPVLANNEGWPEYEFYTPGDHDGCQCDFMPLMLTAEEAAG